MDNESHCCYLYDVGDAKRVLGTPGEGGREGGGGIIAKKGVEA
jgi:hypothetical protein